MIRNRRQIRIVITGPESTGKTTLAKQLAEIYNGTYIPEYARGYIENLDRPYTYQDVETIAKKQISVYEATLTDPQNLFIFDTWLIVTKVWFRWVYKIIPDWLEPYITACPMDLYLLCWPDLPWEADPVRENGGENRILLFREYLSELKKYKFNFVEIEGIGSSRIEQATLAINELMEQD